MQPGTAGMTPPICPVFQLRYWTCPVNVHGLDRGSVTELIEDDLFDLLRPTVGGANDPASVFRIRRDMGPVDYGKLHDAVEGRVATLTKFLRQVRLSVDGWADRGDRTAPLTFRALSTDSHNGGRRPLAIDLPDGRWVLKFTDPRPYHLLSAILDELSAGIGVDLRPPPVVAGRDHQCTFMPYLEPDDGKGHEVEAFMFSLGALTAVAYCLAMVDLHLENLFVFRGKPVIVDPECILHNFPSERRRDRLISTGLLSRTPHLSALRGGDPSNGNFTRVGLCERADGGVDYVRPAQPFHNRLRDADGNIIDPAEHRPSLIGGFKAAFGWFMRHRRLTSDIIDDLVADDFRIRFLVRTTRLYTVSMHILNLPVPDRQNNWNADVFARLRASVHFPEAVTEGVIAAEQQDLEARDVPYFWVNAGEAVIQHRTGPKQSLTHRWNARKQAIADIRSLSQRDMADQVKVLSNFLDADLGTPRHDLGHRRPLPLC